MTDIQLALAHRLHEDAKRSDPLAYRLFSSDEQRACTEALLEGLEVHFRAPNISGKTEWGAAMSVCLLQGRTSLDARTILDAERGEPYRQLELPRVETPCVGYMVTPGYKQALEAGIAAVKKALGDWPHKIIYATGKSAGYVSAFLVKPIGCRSDDTETWSRLTVFVDEGIPPEGGRIDFAWADEPPSERVWREIRMRRKANQPFHRFITETPLERARWEWLRKDYEDSLTGKREIVMRHISGNQALSLEHVAAQEADAEGDPLKRARLFGEYVDTSGLCPFDYKGLEQLSAWAEPGTPWEFDSRVEVWRRPDPSESYFVLFDPSSGKLPGIRWVGNQTQDVKRDRCGLWVVSRRKLALCARLYDYLAPHELTELAMEIGYHYNSALLVPETNGVGEGVVPMLLKAGYPNIYQEFATDRKDFRQTPVLGWNSTADRRAAGIAALARQIENVSKGRQFFDIPSAAAIDSLKSIHQDERGRPVRRPGQNWEDMILGGMASFLAEHPAFALSPIKTPEEMSPGEKFEAMMEREHGRKFRLPRSKVNPTADRWR